MSPYSLVWCFVVVVVSMFCIVFVSLCACPVAISTTEYESVLRVLKQWSADRLRALYYDVIITCHDTSKISSNQHNGWKKRISGVRDLNTIPEMIYQREREKKNIYHTKNTIKQIWKRSGPFGLIWRKVTITLMFGLKLFLNEALEGFWSGAQKQKSDGETPGSIHAGTVPAVSKPFIKPRYSKISIDLNRL